MTVLDVIVKAQRLLAGDRQNGPGWTGPEHCLGLCLRKAGMDDRGRQLFEVCEWDDEMVFQYTAFAALRIAARNDAVLLQTAWDELQEVIAPSRAAERRLEEPTTVPEFRTWCAVVKAAAIQPDIDAWLQDPARKFDEVLGAFDVVKLKLEKGLDA